MKTFRWIVLFLTLTVSAVSAESLWDEEFSGYVSQSKKLTEGQIVTVTIDASTKLTFTSTKAGDKELTLTFSGGETGDLFSFLPEISSGTTQSREGEEDIELSTQLAARVQETADTGLAYIQGSRSMQIQGAVEAVTVTGWLRAEDLDQDNRIPFAKLAESELTFRTFLDSEEQILTENDIVEAVAELRAEAEVTPGEAEEAGETPAAGEGAPDEAEGTAPEAGTGAGETGPRYRLSEEKKRELLLQYINNLIDLIFQ
jgi:flagellar basal body L-ring protein FlgH